MTTTRLQLYPRVLHRLGYTSDDGRMTTTLVYQDIENGLEQMSTVADWPWLIQETTFNTVQGTQTYSLPARFVRTRMAAINNINLASRHRRDMLTWVGDDGSLLTGIPIDFATQGNNLYLGPTPDGVYTVTHTYIVPETVLAGDTDVILCPDWYVDAVVVFCALSAAERILDNNQIARMQMARDTWIKQLGDDTTRNEIQPGISIRRDW